MRITVSGCCFASWIYASFRFLFKMSPKQKNSIFHLKKHNFYKKNFKFSKQKKKLENVKIRNQSNTQLCLILNLYYSTQSLYMDLYYYNYQNLQQLQILSKQPDLDRGVYLFSCPLGFFLVKLDQRLNLRFFWVEHLLLLGKNLEKLWSGVHHIK